MVGMLYVMWVDFVLGSFAYDDLLLINIIIRAVQASSWFKHEYIVSTPLVTVSLPFVACRVVSAKLRCVSTAKAQAVFNKRTHFVTNSDLNEPDCFR